MVTSDLYTYVAKHTHIYQGSGASIEAWSMSVTMQKELLDFKSNYNNANMTEEVGIETKIQTI